MADPEGARGVCSHPALRTNFFFFMENFQKSEEKLMKNLVKLKNQTPFSNLNPLSRNPGSAPIYATRPGLAQVDQL